MSSAMLMLSLCNSDWHCARPIVAAFKTRASRVMGIRNSRDDMEQLLLPVSSQK